jgi:hypothetical protein
MAAPKRSRGPHDPASNSARLERGHFSGEARDEVIAGRLVRPEEHPPVDGF